MRESLKMLLLLYSYQARSAKHVMVSPLLYHVLLKPREAPPARDCRNLGTMLMYYSTPTRSLSSGNGSLATHYPSLSPASQPASRMRHSDNWLSSLYFVSIFSRTGYLIEADPFDIVVFPPFRLNSFLLPNYCFQRSHIVALFFIFLLLFWRRRAIQFFFP